MLRCNLVNASQDCGSSGLSAAVCEQEKGAQPFPFAGRAVQARRTRVARTARCWTRSRAGQRLLKPCRGVGRDAREKNPGHEPENWRPPSVASELLVLQVRFNTPRTRDNTYGIRTHTGTPPRTGARTGTGTGWPFGVMDRLGPPEGVPRMALCSLPTCSRPSASLSG